MRVRVGLVLLTALAMVARASHGQIPSRNNALKSNTRLITVDVVATDSHGNVVRSLTQNDFEVYGDHHAPQSIVRFEFVDGQARRALADSQAAPAPGVFSNQAQSSAEIAPTVILLDALNTSTIHRMQIRREMILFLQNVPQDTPIAVFLLGHRVHVVQNFTSNPSILRAAIEQISGGAKPIENENYPQYDANSPSDMMLQSDPETPASVVQSLEDRECELSSDGAAARPGDCRRHAGDREIFERVSRPQKRDLVFRGFSDLDRAGHGFRQRSIFRQRFV